MKETKVLIFSQQSSGAPIVCKINGREQLVGLAKDRKEKSGHIGAVDLTLYILKDREFISGEGSARYTNRVPFLSSSLYLLNLCCLKLLIYIHLH